MPVPIAPLAVAVQAVVRLATTVRRADRQPQVVMGLAPLMKPHQLVRLALRPVTRLLAPTAIIFIIKLVMLAVTIIIIVPAAINIRFLPVIIPPAEPRRLALVNLNVQPELTVLLASHIHVLAAATARLTV